MYFLNQQNFSLTSKGSSIHRFVFYNIHLGFLAIRSRSPTMGTQLIAKFVKLQILLTMVLRLHQSN